jgi:hypothetical protein
VRRFLVNELEKRECCALHGSVAQCCSNCSRLSFLLAAGADPQISTAAPSSLGMSAGGYISFVLQFSSMASNWTQARSNLVTLWQQPK